MDLRSMTTLGPREVHEDALRSAEERPGPGSRGKTVPGQRTLRAVDGDTENAFQPKVRSLPMRRFPRVEDGTPREQKATPVAMAGREQFAHLDLPKPIEAPAAQSPLSAALEFGERALRLTMDGVLIVVFSPVIAAWWMLERRHKKGRG